jgi:hypothetical protein
VLLRPNFHVTLLRLIAYVMAIGGCDEQTRGMTPEDLGKAGDPFLPWKQTAAMVRAA